MRITRITIENFRSLDGFSLNLDAESRFIVGENAIGKSSLITAVARALGRERSFARSDFRDLARAIEIQATLVDLTAAQLGVFADAADFGAVPSVSLGITAVWDPDSEEIETTHGYPTKGWAPSKRIERDAIDLHWISDTRNALGLLQFGSRKSLIAETLADTDLDQAVATAMDELRGAGEKLGQAPALTDSIRRAGVQLQALVPVGAQPFGISGSATTEIEVLRQLQLTLSYGGPPLPITSQSSGLAHLTLFAFSLSRLADRKGSILLIDEPEISLHPQPQKALLRAIQQLPNQTLMTSHSAALLDRVDVRHVVRLYRDADCVKAARPTGISVDEAARLARFTTAESAEAFFARSVVLVEGQSDKYALEAVAAKKGRNLDAEGITVLAMRGAGGLDTYLNLFGPGGLRLELAGLCDANEESKWAKALEAHGLGANLDRAQMSNLGFEVCVNDLEEVLITAAGEQTVLAVIAAQGAAKDFDAFAQQPNQRPKTLARQLHDFLHSRGRNITYAPLIVDAMESAQLPPALERVINAA